MMRYSIECDDVGPLGVAKDDDGEYVRHDDVAALCKAVVDWGNAMHRLDEARREYSGLVEHEREDAEANARNHMLKLAKDGHDESQ